MYMVFLQHGAAKYGLEQIGARKAKKTIYEKLRTGETGKETFGWRGPFD